MPTAKKGRRTTKIKFRIKKQNLLQSKKNTNSQCSWDVEVDNMWERACDFESTRYIECKKTSKDMSIEYGRVSKLSYKKQETRRLFFLYLIIVLAITVGCGNDKNKITNFDGDGYRGVIFGEKCSDLKYLEMRYPTKMEFWTPKNKNVVEAEIAISKFLGKNGSKHYDTELVEEIIKNLDRYIRQYCGVIINKNKCVYCSFIKEYNSDNINAGIYRNWENELICTWFIADGGTDYFDILYDVKKKMCKKFSMRH